MVKKIALLLALAIAASAPAAQAQSNKDRISSALGSLLGGKSTSASTDESSSSEGSSAQNTLGGLLSGLVGSALPLTQDMIVGTWDYSSPDVRFSSDNALAKAGGAVAAQTVEQKVADIYSRLGIAPGKCYFTFAEDGTCSMRIGKVPMSGTYTLDTKTRQLSLKLKGGIKLNAAVYYDTKQLTLLFEADKLMSFAKSVSKIAGRASSTVSSLSSVLDNYNGMQLGMNLTPAKETK